MMTYYLCESCRRLEYAHVASGQGWENNDGVIICPDCVAKKVNLLEALAELEHEQWMEWTKSITDQENLNAYQRWFKLWVPYAELSEENKEKDREWARKVLKCISTHIST
jgi:hypothetical protein